MAKDPRKSAKKAPAKKAPATTEMATSAPGYGSVRPMEKAPIAETLRLNIAMAKQ